MTHRPLTDYEIRSPWYKYAWVSAKDTDSGLPYALKNLKENTLFFQSPVEFNDLYDCKMIIDQCSLEEWDASLRKCIQEKYCTETQEKRNKEYIRIKATSNFQRAYKKFSSSFVKSFERLGVMCLTGNHKDILMWAHYGEKNVGICLEIDLELCIQTIQSRNIPLDFGYVNYKQKIPKVIFLESFLSSNENAALEDAEKIIFCKNELWEKEKEIRIVIPNVEELAKGRLICFPEGIYKSVILGARCDSFNIDQVKEVLRNKRKQIPLLQIVPSEQEYNLEMKQLDY